MDGDVILSQEGTTQGDPLAMPMYGLATIPLIRRLNGLCKQVWYADESAAIGKIEQLRAWWDRLVKQGPAFGYFPNPSKTWIVTKQEYHKEVTEVFADYGINITPEGRPYLRAAIGSEAYITEYVSSKVKMWSSSISILPSARIDQLLLFPMGNQGVLIAVIAHELHVG